MLIINAKIVLEDCIIDNGCVLIQDGKIKAISNIKPIMPREDDVLDAKNCYVMAGFIDQHTHGGYGFDVMDSTVESLDAIAYNILREGVTSFAPTTMTKGKEEIINALRNVKRYKEIERSNRSEIVGIHLEGPFINKSRKGAQGEKHIINPSVEMMKEFEIESGNLIKIVTYAPELDENFEFTEYLRDHAMTPSVGHSGASCEMVMESVDHGATGITHLHNGQSPHDHRKPGVVTAGLLDDRLKTEIICDLIHIAPESIRLTYKCKGDDSMILITDSIRAKGLEDGQYELGGQAVTVKGKEARLDDGTLAGSVLKMNEALRNAKSVLGINMITLSKLASSNPAKQLGVYSTKGSVTVGKDADLVITDENINVIRVVKLGKIVEWIV